MNILELAEILSEAGGYLQQAQVRGVEMREPIVDELHGFASMVIEEGRQDKARIATLEAELLAARDLLSYKRVGWQWCTYSTDKDTDGKEEGWSDYWQFEANENYLPRVSERVRVREVFAKK